MLHLHCTTALCMSTMQHAAARATARGDRTSALPALVALALTCARVDPPSQLQLQNQTMDETSGTDRSGGSRPPATSHLHFLAQHLQASRGGVPWCGQPTTGGDTDGQSVRRQPCRPTTIRLPADTHVPAHCSRGCWPLFTATTPRDAFVGMWCSRCGSAMDNNTAVGLLTRREQFH